MYTRASCVFQKNSHLDELFASWRVKPIISQGVVMRIMIDMRKCHGSGECIKACPHGALHIVDGKAVVDHARCDLDGLCLPACPNDAIDLVEES